MVVRDLRAQVIVRDEQGSVVASNKVDLTNGWQRYMLSGLQPLSSSKHYYSLRCDGGWCLHYAWLATQ